MSEAIAILSYTRSRSIEFSSSLFSVIDPAKAERAVKDFRNLVFPEDAYENKCYEERARQIMKKMMGVNIMIKPEKTIGTMDFKRIK